MIDALRFWMAKKILDKHWDSSMAEAKRQGGIESFSFAHKDIMETMRDDLEKQANDLADRKLAELLVGFDPKDIMKMKPGGVICIGGEDADAIRVSNLKSEAEFLTNSELWKVLYANPMQLAHESMFIHGDSLAHLQKGRSVIFMLETQRKILEVLLAVGK